MFCLEGDGLDALFTFSALVLVFGIGLGLGVLNPRAIEGAASRPPPGGAPFSVVPRQHARGDRLGSSAGAPPGSGSSRSAKRQ